MWNLLQDELGGGVWPRLLVALVDTGAKGLILMAAAGLAAAALRRNAAAARHLVWMLALCGLLILPVVSLMMPKWTLPILPAIEAPAPPPEVLTILPIPVTKSAHLFFLLFRANASNFRNSSVTHEIYTRATPQRHPLRLVWLGLTPLSSR